MKLRSALSIAGSDPSGGAGIQADLKVFHHHKVYGMSVITLCTVQNTVGVKAVRTFDPQFVLDQLDAVLEDIPPHAAKTGALGSAEVIDALCYRTPSFSFPLVIDPVMVSKHGARLIEEDAISLLKHKLIPTAYLVTPNSEEAQILAERHIDSEASAKKAAQTISLLGIKHVLVKGGHLQDALATDVLFSDGSLHTFSAPRIDSTQTHGTGCALSAAITSQLSIGSTLLESIKRSKQFISAAVQQAPGIGRGTGPINLWAPVG